VPPYGNEPDSTARRRDIWFAALVILLAISTTYLGETVQQGISNVVQGSVLRPFIALQEALNDARRRGGEIDVITQRLDSVTAILATQSAVVEENRLLRDMLGLVERGGPRFVPATALRPGTAGSESMFVVDVGARDGVPMGAAVVGPQGLIGVIHEVRSQSAVGMDWSHPDFRASAMLVDGSSYGIVERRRGIFQEDDRLVLSGTAYTTRVRPGTVVITSGLAGVLPRGIPIGKIDRLLDTEGSWRKSFWIEPMVEPGAATHVLVLTEGSAGDFSGVWPVDSLLTREEAIGRDPGS
jgi:rod shape-determining protein MreC